MKVSTKAVLMSALLFPGLGHLALRPPRGRRGLLFLIPTLAALLYLVRSVMQLADQLLAEINRGALAFDPAEIVARTQAASASDATLNLVSAVLFVGWIGAIVDVLWLSRRTPT